jgi:hypothetical protein
VIPGGLRFGFDVPPTSPADVVGIPVAQSPERKLSVFHFSSENETDRGRSLCPTPKEYRQQADECLELTNEANEWYVRIALVELAAAFRKRAQELERTERTRQPPLAKAS